MLKPKNKLVDFFTYKEPANDELGFELLDDENEGNETATPRNPAAGGGQKPQAEAPPKRRFFQWKEKKQQQKADRLTNADDISSNLQINLDAIRRKFNMPKNMDVIVREFVVGRKLKSFMVYVDNMIDKKQIYDAILPRLMAKDVFDGAKVASPADYLMENIIVSHYVKKVCRFHEAITGILQGATALFIDGCGDAILMMTLGVEKRSIGDSKNEPVIRGSQESYTEHLGTNVAMIRNIIRNEHLVTEFLPVGNTNHSQCAVMYLDGVVNQAVVQEVIKRIKRVNVDFIAGNSHIEQFIEDNPYMIFPQTIYTERPDRGASFIMDGKVLIITEGTPSSLAVPSAFFHVFHTSEDANLRWPFASLLRLVRFLGMTASIILPALYVALVLHHPEMIPSDLLSSIVQAKEKVPLPTVVEVLLLEISFELIREGAIRVPSIIGQTLGIVGALILGQAAVAANIISPAVVIIVSLTAIGSFTIPNYEMGLACRILRFFFILAAASLGFLGMSIGLVIVLTYACSLKSFGVPFFIPFTPKTKDGADFLVKYPITKHKDRPDVLNTPDRTRQGQNVKSWIKEP